MTLEQYFENTPLAAFDRGGLVKDETLAFIWPDEEKQLLFPAERVISVTSCDGTVVYEPGRDYVLRGGKLLRAAGSAIPVITPEVYYTEGEQPLLQVTGPDGKPSPCYFNGSGTMGKYQVMITYEHAMGGAAILPPCGGRYARFLQKLEHGEDVTVLFYGDSITYGADASLVHGRPPHLPPYPMRFACAVAELYGYAVRFALPGAESSYGGPFPKAPEGCRGTLTLVNTAVGGWTSEDGVNRFDTHIAPQLKAYGCSLFALAFGMNDGGRPPEETAANCEKIVRRVLSSCKDAAVMLVSTMLPNPAAINGWYANQPLQEPALISLADRLNAEGCPCDAAGMTSVSAAVLRRKGFIDITGNNINHPNDYFHRVYAVTLLQTLIGYDAQAFQA